MLSKAKIKFIKSLQIKKYRKQEQSFIVEGAKSVRELLDSDFDLVMLAGTKGFLSTVSAKNHVEVIEVVVLPLGDLQAVAGEHERRVDAARRVDAHAEGRLVAERDWLDLAAADQRQAGLRLVDLAGSERDGLEVAVNSGRL